MKIALVAGGHLPIPPNGWGGVEHLIWNFYQQLTKSGDEVTIINTQDLDEIVDKVNSGNFDAVHLHYDGYADIMEELNCDKKLITSHYPYLTNPEREYLWIFEKFKNAQSHVVSLSDAILDQFVRRGVSENNSSVLPCGIETESYSFEEEATFFDRSIVVGKIEPRKRQAFLQNRNLNIDFIGNCVDPSFNTSDPCYFGEQSKEDIMENLTAYANMILLSSGEAHPFVCLEAMASGLGLVLSEQSTANLDLTQPFITVIPDNKINDIQYLREKIEENRKVSLGMRKTIREYCQQNFDWSVIIEKYKQIINNI